MRISISIFLFFLVLSTNAQNSRIKSCWTLAAVNEIDENQEDGIIYFRDANLESHALEAAKVKKATWKFEKKDAGFFVDANVLSYGTKNVILPASITSAARIENFFLIAAENQLYRAEIPLDIVAEEFALREQDSLSSIQSIHYESPYVVVQDSSQILIWNHLSNEWKKYQNAIGEIADVVLSNFGVLYLGGTQGLFSLNLIDKSNSEAPFLKLKEEGREEYRKEIDLDSGDFVVYTIEAMHPVFQEDVKIYSVLESSSKREEQEVKNGVYILNDLKTGSYTLRFYTKLKDKSNASFSETIKLKVETPNQYQIWKYLFGVLTALLIFSLYSQQKDNRFHDKVLQQRDTLALENKALKFERQALQLQMNPHFIFNVLNSINGMIAINKKEEARKYINEFAHLMRAVLNQSRSESISLEKEIDYLEKYLSLEKVTRNDSFEYIIKVDPGLDLESETLPMIIQPFLENSIIHGFKKMDRKAKLNLSFKEEAGNLKVEVLDNGMGRMMDATKTTQKESLGLSVVKERLGLNYGYQFLDLKDEQGIPSGTKVIIKMPLK